jgi:hypothetical protein
MLAIAAVLFVCAVSAAPAAPAWAVLHPGGLKPNADFGSAVATFQLRRAATDKYAAHSVVVTVSGAQNNRNQTGSLYLFTALVDEKTGNWSQTTLAVTVEPPGLTAGANYGCAIAVAASTEPGAPARLLVGAQYDADKAGAVYAYRVGLQPFSTGGIFVTPLGVISRPPAPAAPAPRFFGSAVALSNDGRHAVVGAASGNTSGAAFTYRRNGDGYLLQQTLTSHAFGPGVNFGQSVAVDNDANVAVGVNHFDGNRGAVVVYPKAQQAQAVVVTVADLPQGSYFGSQVALWQQPDALQAAGKVLLFAAAGWAPKGGQVFAIAVSPATGATAVLQRLSAPPGTGAKHTFGCSFAVLPGAVPSAGAALFVGDWSYGSGHVFQYEVDIGAATAATFRATLTRALAAFPASDAAYFGASVSAALLNGTAAASSTALLVGAFGAFSDQGAAALTLL